MSLLGNNGNENATIATSDEQHLTTTFPKFLQLPFELQMCVWLEVLNEPSINFWDAKVEPLLGNTSLIWYPKLRAISSSHDDSAFRRNEGLAVMCPSAARALRIAYGSGLEGPELSDQSRWIDKKTDIVCLRSLVYPSNISRISWHNDYRSRDTQSPEMDYSSTRHVYSGLQKVGIAYRDVVYHPRNWAFPCHDESVWNWRNLNRTHSHTTSYCPLQLASFIDCFPDIKEFFFVISFQARHDTAGTVQEWCDEHGMKDLAVYRGHKRCYYEVHRVPRRSGTGACDCPLSPKCHGNGSLPVDHCIYALLERVRGYLLVDTITWKLSFDQRQNIKFTVLLKGVDESFT